MKLEDKSDIKVHRQICLQLKCYVDRVSEILSAVESSRPRCATGLEALCLLRACLDKAKLLIQTCSESSKLYLAITGERLLLRCKGILNDMGKHLIEIQSVVPSFLAAELSGITEDLRSASFRLEYPENEAGKILLELLRQDVAASDSLNNAELESLKLAAMKLKIISPLAVFLEKRSIRILFEKARDTEQSKKKILKYFLYLLRNYGRLLGELQTEIDNVQDEEIENRCIYPKSDVCTASDDTQVHDSGTIQPPQEYLCPISKRLMHDPVIISSGRTYERVSIEKWFNEGQQTCPVSQMRLENFSLTPNIVMKGLIKRWCSRKGITISDPHKQSASEQISHWKLSPSSSVASMASLGSSMNDLCLQVSNVSFQSSENTADLLDDDNNAGVTAGLPEIVANLSTSGSCCSLASLKELGSHPWRHQCIIVQNLRKELSKNQQTCDCIFLRSYFKSMIRFMRDARDFRDAKAQEDSLEVLLGILSKSSIEMYVFDEDSVYLLLSFLDTDITGKVLAILELLSSLESFRSAIAVYGLLPSILKVFDRGVGEFHQLALKILRNLSCNKDGAYHILYLDFISKFACFLGDCSLAWFFLDVIVNLCNIEDGKIAVLETDSFTSSIAELLETGTKQEQETTLEVLLSLCHENGECCKLLADRKIVQCLSFLSINGRPKAKAIAAGLLQLVGQMPEDNIADSSSGHSSDHPKGKTSVSIAVRYVGKKISRLLH
ncbi:hypothetical protein K2173_027934 [Erythroxylum novogranatense]|uniref:RING-type E3 ubiquitin transferase n=1 Tax=Erythroxylum novogranatense TaxID=1862640 RepID=A0AAV8U0I2_9ROSI|nr:hypothetical protein K2173_027934 [Erythroxylum novogranatense]